MDDHKKVILVGGTTITLMASEYPEIFKGCPADVTGVAVTCDNDCEIESIDFPEKRDLLAMGMVYPLNVPDLEDRRAEAIIDEPHSWQQMNRGKMSKKQRRK